MLEAAKASLESKSQTVSEFPIYNTDRAVGTIVSHEITKTYQSEGLPEDTMTFKFRGTA